MLTGHTVILMGFYLKHVCVVIMAVLHHHRLISGQRVGDAVLAFTVHSLKYNKQIITKYATQNILWYKIQDPTKQMQVVSTKDIIVY